MPMQFPLTRSGRSEEDDSLRRLDPNILVQLGVRHGQLDGLLHLLDLLLQAADVRVRLRRRLVHFHHVHHRVNVVAEKANHAHLKGKGATQTRDRGWVRGPKG